MLEQVSLVAHAPALIDDPLQVLTDPAGWVASWLWGAIFGKDAVAQPNWPADLFARAFFFTGLDPGDCSGGTGGGNCSSFSIWSALQTTGYLVLAAALMFRMLRDMFDPGKRPLAKWLVFDVVARAAFAVAAINVSYVVLAALMHSSIVVGGALFDSIMSVTTGSAADEAGLQRGDVIMSINREPVKNLKGYNGIISRLGKGE
ncbi:MAG TPA: PDZ domain-containing protein, partial [Candidatus Eisenbacteria bacterium]|nr:PDZ domain-containing protein [Candidatus Eisenbacteria bacterium]